MGSQRLSLAIIERSLELHRQGRVVVAPIVFVAAKTARRWSRQARERPALIRPPAAALARIIGPGRIIGHGGHSEPHLGACSLLDDRGSASTFLVNVRHESADLIFPVRGSVGWQPPRRALLLSRRRAQHLSNLSITPLIASVTLTTPPTPSPIFSPSLSPYPSAAQPVPTTSLPSRPPPASYSVVALRLITFAQGAWPTPPICRACAD
ncbi:hypothetical protein BDZ90DRAFT_123141 [Jaminaea rosea]|uniref:Uncharacterized protein n=1 Tax=Jaminaea rosea TaxID=1569628 RepID=A0A316UHK2_9BASI|nr:hypothetical protein BDZ90DRAFT_123141 [Jaminaea rosea]PWN24394.1 hypothetical protein BDZ90DRAFT_123141 [Jaminaea rosea]